MNIPFSIRSLLLVSTLASMACKEVPEEEPDTQMKMDMRADLTTTPGARGPIYVPLTFTDRAFWEAMGCESDMGSDSWMRNDRYENSLTLDQLGSAEARKCIIASKPLKESSTLNKYFTLSPALSFKGILVSLTCSLEAGSSLTISYGNTPLKLQADKPNRFFELSDLNSGISIEISFVKADSGQNCKFNQILVRLE